MSEFVFGLTIGVMVGSIALVILQRRKRLSPDQKIMSFVEEVLPIIGWHDLLSGVINSVAEKSDPNVWPDIGDYLLRKSQARRYTQ